MADMPARLTEVGALERPNHWYLPEGASCYFWGEYTPYEHTNGLKWDFSPTNRLITNFKKKLERKALPDWRYKQLAIQQIARAFTQIWNWKFLREQRVALIPIPPSKARTDPAFDSRMHDVLTATARLLGQPLDIRDCLSFSGAYAASHECNDRPSPDDLYGELTFDGASGRPHQPPGVILLLDDMLTTGAHFVAASRKLGEVFPGVPVIGGFVARRIVPNPADDFDVIDSDF